VALKSSSGVASTLLTCRGEPRVSIIYANLNNIFLSLAREGRASRIVSGDRHLLALGDFEGITIVSVRAFLEEMGKV
jgi:predicted nucleic acid-binding protein